MVDFGKLLRRSRVAKTRRASTKPSEMFEGGKFGFPPQSVVTIVGAKYVTFEDAGEKAAEAYGENTPCLRLEGEIEGSDADEPTVVHLSAGSADRLVPSEDGQYVEIAEEAPDTTTMSKSCAAGVFIVSLCDKKRQGKMALNEDDQDSGVEAFLVGMKFVAGQQAQKDEGGTDKDGREFKRRPQLIAEEIKVKPTGKKGKKGKAKDEDEEDAKPKGKKDKKPAKADDDDDADEDAGSDDASEAAEKAILKALENPKYRKGLPKNRLVVAVNALVKDDDNAEAIVEQVQDDEWIADDERPWSYDSEEELITKA